MDTSRQQMAIEMPTGINYVAGTINGEMVVLQKHTDRWWKTVVNRSPNGRYAIDLTAYYETGESTEYKETHIFYPWLIYDREPNDPRGEEYEKYNYTDRNRVETAVKIISGTAIDLFFYLLDYMRERGVSYNNAILFPYFIDEMTVDDIKTDWDLFSKPTASEHKRYISNVRQIVLYYKWLETVPLPTATQPLDYVDANNIERALHDLWSALLIFEEETKALADQIKKHSVYSGEIFVGDL